LIKNPSLARVVYFPIFAASPDLQSGFPALLDLQSGKYPAELDLQSGFSYSVTTT
jgi:hypothetical protein